MKLHSGYLVIKLAVLNWHEFELGEVVASLPAVVKPAEVVSNFDLAQKLACCGAVSCGVVSHCISGDHLEIGIFNFKTVEHLVCAFDLWQVVSELIAVRT